MTILGLHPLQNTQIALMHKEAAAARDLELEVGLREGAVPFCHQQRQREHGRLGVPVVAVYEDLARTRAV